MTGRPRGDGVDVATPALRRHATSVDAVTDRVRVAQAAARHVRLGTEAYGRLCTALPAMLDPLHDLADQVLAAAEDALDGSAHALRTAAGRYEASDAAAGDRFGGGR